MDNDNTNANSGAENTEGVNNQTTGVTDTKPNEVNYEELLKTDKKLQSFLDSRISKANETAVKNARETWETEQNTKLSEAEKLSKMNEKQKLQYQMQQKDKTIEEIQKKLNARDLKDEALKIATTQDTAFDPEFLNLFDYENMTAEQLQEKTKLIKAIQDRIVAKAVNEWSKEKPPYNPDPTKQKTTLDEQIDKIMGLKK